MKKENVFQAVEAAPFGLEVAAADGSLIYRNEALRQLFADGEPQRTIWTGREPWEHDIQNFERHGGCDLFVEFDFDGGREPTRWRIPDARRQTPGDTFSYRVFRFAQKNLPGSEMIATWVMDATRTETERQHLAQSLDAAAALQEAIFRTDNEREKLSHFDYKIYQKEETGGDFIFARKISETRDLLVVGDCFGHGVVAALLTAIVGISLQRWFASRDKKIENVKDLLLRIDSDIQRYLYRITDQIEGPQALGLSDNSPPALSESDITFSTGLDAMAIIIDQKEGSIEYARAGRSISTYLLRGRKDKDKVNRIENDEGAEAPPAIPAGLPDKGLGTRRPAGQAPTIETGRRKNLENRDKIVVLTDGLEKQVGPPGRSRQGAFGRNRIEQILEENAAQGPKKLARELCARWGAHRGQKEYQQDDTAVAVLEFRS